MKGSEKVIESLNALLMDEMTAVHQYILHAEMCEDWGYKKLAEAVRQRALDEMKHVDRLIERILFLEGQPLVGQLRGVNIGREVKTQLENDLQSEREAVAAYNQAIALAAREGDNGTKDLLEEILADEERHVDWLETQLNLLESMGLENYLSTQAA